MNTKPSALEVERHNNVTQTIIVGMMCQHLGEVLTQLPPGQLLQTASEIMLLLERRGYEPQILRCNQLKNGRTV